MVVFRQKISIKYLADKIIYSTFASAFEGNSLIKQRSLIDFHSNVVRHATFLDKMLDEAKRASIQ
jgi:hypothetical protein